MRMADQLARNLYGMTQKEAWAASVCIKCKAPVLHELGNPSYKQLVDEREYRISAICGPCFDKMVIEEEDDEDA